ncbi:MAG: chemotaxis protein CheW [Caldimicrobium sp.]|nr:chemotaxis protein CheW [Caldimicrobium sp.]MCX7874116.1 chemotaxis protein CheW [Caldimicrobium sp.]MDW8093749.1 chemotaxis protein CheW [Caldimicrobium sp.]
MMIERNLPTTKESTRTLTTGNNVTLVTFYLGDYLFGIRAEKVMEINRDLDITPVPHAADYILGIMNLRGQIITVIDLSKKIKTKLLVQPRLNLILRHQDEVAAFLIEKIDDILEVPLNKLEEPPEKIEGINKEFVENVYQLPDKLLIILNVNKIFDH